MFKIIAALSLVFSVSALAQNKSEKIQIISTTVSVEDFEVNHMRTFSTVIDDLGDLMNPLNQAEIVIDKIINMGQKVWNIIEKGKPVVNYQQYTASALPQGVQTWQQMQGWAGKSMTQEISVINGFGSEKVKFTYRLVFFYNGTTAQGAGKYIGYATIEPANLNVGWGGYKFNAQVSVPAVFNMGTIENPVAAMKIQIKYTTDTIVQHEESTDSFVITGSGKVQAL